MQSVVLVALLGWALFPSACSPTQPTPPTNEDNDITVPITVIVGGTQPGTSPSPGTQPTPTEAEVTIIGNSTGRRVFAVNELITATFTRYARVNGNRQEVHGQPTDNVEWFVVGIQDLESGGGRVPDNQNYNRDLRVGPGPGPFAVTARQGNLEATFAAQGQ